jgi:hypothetical protein
MLPKVLASYLSSKAGECLLATFSIRESKIFHGLFYWPQIYVHNGVYLLELQSAVFKIFPMVYHISLDSQNIFTQYGSLSLYWHCAVRGPERRNEGEVSYPFR